MNDEIKEILDCLELAIDSESYKTLLDYITNLQQYYKDNVNRYEELIEKYSNLQQENERLIENNINMQEEMARVWEENERLKKIRNEAICYNKELCKIYDCGMELSNAQTNLCILEDTETLNILQNGSDSQ